MKNSKSLLLGLLAILFLIQAIQAQTNKHPHIFVTDDDKAGILANIANHDWANDMYVSLLSKVDAAVEIHKADPGYYTSRIPLTWGGENYTKANGSNDNGPPNYSGTSILRTLHRATYYSPKAP